jgi:hypothetical protein
MAEPGKDTPSDAQKGPQDASEGPDGSQTAPEGSDDLGVDGQTFTADYVKGLRDENAKYRTRAKKADDLAARLVTSMVSATGRLADPTDP